VTRVVVVVPAHNEAASIATTLRSVRAQTYSLERVLVVCDNCTDDTAAIAADYAQTMVTVGNTDKKAGALNQALEIIVPALDDDDCLLVIDADTTIEPDFVAASVNALRANPNAGGISSTFVGRGSANLLGLFQSMEYFRYQRQIRRNGGRAYVLSGTASVLRVSALRTIVSARGSVLPDGGGSYYDTTSLTEDNEITLALLMLGYLCLAPSLTSTTDVMPSIGKLFRQRHRWYLGAMRNIWGYGKRLPWYMRWTYWRQQFGLLVSICAISAYLVLMVLMPSATVGRVGVLALAPMALLGLERVTSVWRMGWRARIIAALVVPEQIYSIFLTIVYGAALKDFMLRRKGAWHAT
jgi:biofilm PGA synthesis N-glycosyltransferase PgaC